MLWISLDYLFGISFLAMILTWNILPKFRDTFIKANIYGIDMSKKTKGVKVPEATGVISGCVFLMVTFIMIPVAFSHYFGENKSVNYPQIL